MAGTIRSRSADSHTNGFSCVVVVNDDQASVVTILDSLVQEPAGDTLWIGDGSKQRAIALPMPN
jgi:hypothetical protein